MPKHIVRLLCLLLAFLVFAYAAIVYLTDPSFYRFGHYRADVVPELAAGEPMFRGPDYCQTCHAERHTEWSGGAHLKVKCEICHGPAGQHPATGKLPIPADPTRLCTGCHEAMPARPEAQPQIVIAEHPFPHEQPIICSTCHNPHSPRIGASAVPTIDQQTPEALPEAPATVQAPAAAAGCSGCHGAKGEGVGAFPALAGTPGSEFIKQMNLFRSGERPSPMMASIANSVSEEDIALLAAYYASLDAGAP
jgi:predicted CXXCH cytochrome family protein